MSRHHQLDEAQLSEPTSVLVVGTDDWAVEQVSATLSEAGCQILTCHPPGEPVFPCNALVEGRTCPLDAGFSVVVTVRARPVDQPIPGELGVICGLHAGAPLVIAGMSARNPFLPWAARSVGPGESLPAVVVGVAASARVPAAADVRMKEPAPV
ncbi:MAG: hypothetical protein ACRDYV_01125 [Acidimicrobiia bacterium]